MLPSAKSKIEKDSELFAFNNEPYVRSISSAQTEKMAFKRSRRGLKMTISSAQELYIKSSVNARKGLIKKYGEDCFSDIWMSLFWDFCQEADIDMDLPHNSLFADSEFESINALSMLATIVGHYRKGWQPNSRNKTQKKYFLTLVSDPKKVLRFKQLFSLPSRLAAKEISTKFELIIEKAIQY